MALAIIEGIPKSLISGLGKTTEITAATGEQCAGTARMLTSSFICFVWLSSLKVRWKQIKTLEELFEWFVQMWFRADSNGFSYHRGYPKVADKRFGKNDRDNRGNRWAMRWDCTNADKQFYLFCLIELAQGQMKTNKNTRRTLRVIRANVIPSGFEPLS